MNKGLLPIGTVLVLKGGTKKVMVTGYYSKAKDDDKIYDYNGCIFPEGLMENLYCLFNSNQIEEVFYRGLENDESEEYVRKISSTNEGVSYGVFDSDTVSVGNVDTRRRRTPKAPKNPRSKSEMLNKYSIKKISGENIKHLRRY